MKNVDIRLLQFRTMNCTIHNLFNQINNKDLLLQYYVDKEKQEWNDIQKSQYIESIMMRAPILPIVIYDGINEYEIIDGLNRIKAVYEFIKGSYKLNGLNFLCELNGNKYSDFPNSYQRRIEETRLHIHAIEGYKNPELTKLISERYM